MIKLAQHGDVTACWMSWPRSRLGGYGVYAYAVRGVLVDTGFPGAAAWFADLVARLKPRGAFITHHHEDHAGNVELLAAAGVPLGMDAATSGLVQHPAPIGWYRHFTWKAMTPLATVATPFTDDALSLVPTPGHCDNHHSVWDAGTGTLFAGDLFLGVKTRVAHSSENPRALVWSLRRLAARDPDRVFCAHRGLLPQGASAMLAKADWLEALVESAEARMEAGCSDMVIRRELLGSLGGTHYISGGDYSPNQLIAAIRRGRVGTSGSELTGRMGS